MDSLSTKIVEQIEAYITEDNLRTDSILDKHARENDGWIRLELLKRCSKLSVYNYDTILNALRTKQSNLIELSSFEPRCIRRRCQPLTEHSIQDTQTVVVVTGLPLDIQYEELIEFFNRFYPIRDITKVYSFSKRFQGKIHVIFNKSQDAFAFVQRSKLNTIRYINDDHLLPSSNGYPLVCQMLNDQPKIFQGKSFSTRLNNQSKSNHHSRNCIKSNTCATEQILFCQNIPNTQPMKNLKPEQEKIVFNRYSYEFFIPDDRLKQVHQCIMISVLNPFCFTVQLQEDAIEFDKFQREINEFYNTIDDKQYLLTPNQIRTHLCVICCDPKSSNEKKIWNRSQILDFDPVDNTVNLFYVDLGTWDEYVPINRLRHLTDHFHRHLIRSITCRLAHISPINNDNDQVTWTDEATNQFLAVIEQSTPEIEFLSVDFNGCFYTNLSVRNSGQHVCVNDYLIHIKKAIVDDRQNGFQSDEHNVTPIHPVIALYNRLGEIMQQSLEESRTMSISSSSMSSPSSNLSKLYVKVQHINIDQDILSIIFVHYQKSILIPDFNILTLLKLINTNYNLQTIEKYAFSIRYDCVYITQESNFDLFTQMSSLIDINYSNRIALYPLDFVDYILKHYNFQVADVFLALENAKDVQLHAIDLAQWFTIDNEFKYPITTLTHQPIIPYRLPFSNRLISPT